jgi:hypothetical protein
VGPVTSEIPLALRAVADQVSLRIQHATAFLDIEAGIVRSGREALELRMLRAIRTLGSKDEGAAAMKEAMQAHLRIIGERLVVAVAETGSLESLSTDELKGFAGSVDEVLSIAVEHLERRALRSQGQ